jgi:hypothetical protein
MINYNFSSKLTNYLGKIKDITNRNISFREAPDLEQMGMYAAFCSHPTDILIDINPLRSHSAEDFEQSVAHEATHGQLTYQKDAYNPPDQQITPVVIFIYTMVDDIIVNNLISKAGFSPFPTFYLSQLKEEINKKKKGLPVYARFPDGSREVFIVLRYITAWGIIKFCSLLDSDLKDIDYFLKSFKENFPNEYKLAEKIKEKILKNNIFKSDGRDITIKTIFTIFEK